MAISEALTPQHKSRSQARVLIITPIHRESIVLPQHISVLPGGSRSSLRSFADMGREEFHEMFTIDGPSAGERSMSSPVNENCPEETYDRFMTTWFGEPPGDAVTCCLGFWVPCVLHGKTHWRLKRYASHKDPSDRSWASKEGCNTACWAWFGMGVVTGSIISRILTGFQRAQIRGTYNIRGSLGEDFLLGFFCTTCIQIQNDREVRAREGESHLRIGKNYRKKFKTAETDNHRMTTEQPRQEQPMTYISPQTTSDHQLEMLHTATSSNNISGPILENLGAKEESKVTGKPSKTKCTEKKPKRALKTNVPRIQEMSQIRNQEKAEFSNKSKMRTLQIGSRDMLLQSQQNHPPVCSTAQLNEHPGSQPAISVAQVDKPALAERSHHTLSDCETIDEVTTVDNHSLADCRTVERSESGEEGQELSYIHDFTDCPINKTVLDHYEKETRETQHHGLSECSRVSNTPPEAQELSQHTFPECVRASAVDSENGGGNQHILPECDRLSSAMSEETYVEHGMNDCDQASSSSTEKKRCKHNLTGCSKTRHTYTTRDSFREIDLINPVLEDSIATEDETRDQHSLAHCRRSSLPNDCQSGNIHLGHSMADCSGRKRSSSMESFKRQSCSSTRDLCNTVDIASQTRREHRLASCPTPLVFSHSNLDDNGNRSNGSDQATQKFVMFRTASVCDLEISHQEHVRNESHVKDSLKNICVINFSIDVDSASASDEDVGESTKHNADAKKEATSGQRKRKDEHKVDESQTKAKTSDKKTSWPTKNNAQRALLNVLASNTGKKENTRKGKSGMPAKREADVAKSHKDKKSGDSGSAQGTKQETGEGQIPKQQLR